ncbi:hypothetical protein GCM10010145_30720 [Streptomyces ruber]|uniref:Secreted protein n=2 Tax=Streptomyces TaxID=1883 RepID=A0A918BD06_9ACTN|nr:hypothetical protein [Streptomyces ruber]GGQ58446.1 hypothetical protein GCM10010145_30720 [Streptomyces ruber]
MSRALPKYHKRRIAMIGGAAALVMSGAVIAGSALAGESPGAGAGDGAGEGDGSAPAGASPGTITCPEVESSLPEIPASAQAEVDRNLTLLGTQVQEANQRLVDTVGQGGPDLVRNAVLGPLEDKRVATLNRIETAIGRAAERPEGLEALAPCALGAGGAGGADDAGGAEDTGDADEAGAGAGDEAGAGTGTVDGAEADTGTGTGDEAGTGTATAGAISRPDVASQLPAVPASAQAEVDRNLARLDTQLQEASERLANPVGQGAPDFVRNAILGPLAGKRNAAMRIAISIGRTAEKPQGLGVLATCALDG